MFIELSNITMYMEMMPHLLLDPNTFVWDDIYVAARARVRRLYTECNKE